MSRLVLARAAIAAVWLYEGLWCKVLGGDADQRAVIAAVPFLPPALITATLIGIGVAETALAVWVLTGRHARAAAATQTALLVASTGRAGAFAPAGRLQSLTPGT